MWGSLTLKRNNGEEPTGTLDNLTYSYYEESNKLKNVDGSTTENYTYDQIGNLVSDTE